jgi:hypothetical protein
LGVEPHISHAYVLRINKDKVSINFGQIDGFIFISPLGTFGHLFGFGEYFHPRTMLGLKDHRLDDGYRHVYGLLANNKKVHAMIKVSTSGSVTPQEMAQTVDNFIVENSEILCVNRIPVEFRY